MDLSLSLGSGKVGYGFGYGYSGTAPILQGDYIYYSLDSRDGFCVDDSGIRKIVNNGNVFSIQPAEEEDDDNTETD